MNLSIAIVGLPNAGKSTLFNALLKKQASFAEASAGQAGSGGAARVGNYAFTTIEPNIGVVPVRDTRLIRLQEIVITDTDVNPPIVPATVEFFDIAGLVAGASKGEGLGNKFLAHIRECAIIVNVQRAFTDPDVVHVAGEVNPGRDRGIIETELILADLSTLEKQSEPRGVKDRMIQERWELIVALKKGLDEGRNARDVITDPEKRALVADLHLLTMKPAVYVMNVGEDQIIDSRPRGNDDKKHENNSIAISAKMEQDIASLSEDEQKEYLASVGLEASGLDRLVVKAYETLGLISFLTMGEKEVRAWTVVKGTKAPDASGVIHTDFIKKFIKAEVIEFGELDAIGSKKKARELGKLRLEGKEYCMQDGDVVEFKIGA